jgi:hypothetical protein
MQRTLSPCMRFFRNLWRQHWVLQNVPQQGSGHPEGRLIAKLGEDGHGLRLAF